MQIPNWLIIAGLNTALLAAAAFALWVIDRVTDILIERKQRGLFTGDLRLALQNSDLNWSHVLDFADLRGLERARLAVALRELIREGLTGREQALTPHLSKLEGYLQELRLAEPFEGMPSDIRLHLERLQERDAGNSQLLEPLTAQIRELLMLKSREYRHQKYYTVGGFMLGVVGLLFAGYTYYYPPASVSTSIISPASSPAQK